MTRQAILSGLAFGAAMGAMFGFMSGDALYGAVGGALSGVAFGLAIKKFVEISMSSPRLEVDGRSAEFDPGEVVLHHGPANHFKGIEGVGGKLFLTDRRLRFRSHVVNIQTHDESYPLDEIVAVEAVSTMGIVPNGVLVQLRDGRRERFVVVGRAQWVARLRDHAPQLRLPRAIAHASAPRGG
jgi:hypothetical protein